MTTKNAKRDPRGHVAIVRASPEGPRVLFFDYSRNVTDALRCMARLFVDNDGEGPQYSFPRSVWVQAKAGKWERA